MKGTLQRKPRFEWLSNNLAVRIREGLLHGASFVMALALMFAGHGQLEAHPLWSAFVLFCFGGGYAVASGVFKNAAYVYPSLGLWTFAFFLLCLAAGIPPLVFPVVATLLIWMLWATAPKLESLPHFSNAVYRCIFLTTVLFGFWAVFYHADQQQIPAATFILYGLSTVFFHLRRPRSSYAYSAGIYLAIGALYMATVGGPPVPGQSSLTVQAMVLMIFLLAVLQHRRRPFSEALPFYVTGSALTVICVGTGLLGRQLLLDQLALTAITLGIPALLFEMRRNGGQPLTSRENIWPKSLQITSQATLYATMPLLVIAPMLELGHALWSSLLLCLFCLLDLVRRTAASDRCALGGTMHRLIFFTGLSIAWLAPALQDHSGPDAHGIAVTALICTLVWFGLRKRDSLHRVASSAGDGLATLAILLVCITVFSAQWNFTILTSALIGMTCSIAVARNKRLLVWSAAAAFGSVAVVVLTGLQLPLFSQWFVVEALACTCLITAYFSERNALRAAMCSAAALALAIPGMSVALHIESAEMALMCLAGSLGIPFALAALFYHKKLTSAVWAVVAINFIGVLVLLWAGRLAPVTSLGVALLILVPFLSVGWLKCRVWSYAASVSAFFALGVLLVAGSELGTGWVFMSVASLVCGMMLLVKSDPADKVSRAAVSAVGHAVAVLMVLILCQRDTGVMQWQTILPLLIVSGCYLYGSVQIPGQRSVAWVFLSLAILPASAQLFGSETGTFLILPSILVLAWAVTGFKTRQIENQMDCCRTSALLGLLICLIGAVRGPDQASILFLFCLAGFLVCLLIRKERFYVHLVLLCLALMGYGWIQQFGSHFTQELYFYLLLILGLATVVEVSPYLVGYLDSITPIPFVRMLTLRGLGLSAIVGILVAMTSATGFTLAITEHPIFCTSCHNMDKFYASWQHSSHQDVACVKCHYEPGFTAHLQGKIGALSQVVSFATHRYDVKPHAEVSNKSCRLCHSDIDQNTDAFFKDKVHFSHNLHHDAMLKGRDLPCTVCHSQEAESQHMELASSTCFLCHFYGEGPAVQKTSDCVSCHGAPEGKVDMGSSSFNHDSFFQGREVDCHVCHLSTTQGDALPYSVRCHSCHYGEQMDKLQDVSVEKVHEMHVHDEKMGCFECHGILTHGAPVKVAMTDAQQCASCHETDMQHSLQAKMVMGTAVPDLPGEPNVMLEAGISCRHCHVEKTQLNRGGKEFVTHVSPAEYCATCHGDEDYVETFTMWQEDTRDALESTTQALEETTEQLNRMAPTLPTEEMESLRKRLTRAKELRQVVIDDGSMGIHSVFYAEEILDAAKAEIKAVEQSLEQMK